MKAISEQKSQADLLLTHALIVTMDKSFRVIEDGALAIQDDTIIGVGKTKELLQTFAAKETMDASGRLIIPGLINTHTHSPMTIYRGFADDLPLKEWLYDHVFPIEAHFTRPDNVRAGTRLAIAEMLLSGTTTFNDMYYYMDEMAQVVDQVGMRAVLSEAVINFPAPNAPTPEEGLAEIEKLYRKWQGHPLVTIGVAAHTPYTVPPGIMVKAKALADRYGMLFNVHVSETRWEFDKIMKEYGVSPVRHLHKLGVLDKNMVSIHSVFLTDEDIQLLASHGVGVAHNPQCNMKLASGAARIPELLEAGVEVGVGTDGVASNNDLDLIDEIRTMAFLHKFNSNDPTVISARKALEIATIGGARVLGMDHLIGSVEVGKKADLAILNMEKPHAHPLYNIYSLIVYSLHGADVEHVLVNGRFLVRSSQLQTLDLGRLYDKVERIARQVRQRAEALGVFNNH